VFAIAAVDAVLTMVAQNAARGHRWSYTLAIRLGNAIVAYAQYLGKAVWPKGLALEYLYRGNSLTRWEVLGASLLLLTITALVGAGLRHRYLLVGWLWFLGTLLPMIGLVTQPDLEALADRYAYISFLGLFLMVCWGVAEWAEQQHLPRALLAVASVAVLLVLSIVTHRQVGYWSDRVTLWTHTLEVTHRNWEAETRLGAACRERGQPEQALAHFYRAAEDGPRDPFINLNIAMIEHQRGNPRQAILYYERVLAVAPDDSNNVQVLANLGYASEELGDHARAEQYFLAARQPRTLALAHPAIDWRGAWWRDLGPYLRERFREWGSGDASSPPSR
jgi:tetratricopeptide (TPR) repeat protein